MHKQAKNRQAEAQNRVVKEALGDLIGTGPRDGSTRYMFRNGYILVRDEYRREVRALLQEAGFVAADDTATTQDQAAAAQRGPEPRREDVVHGVRLLRLDGGNSDTHAALDVVRLGYGRSPGFGSGVASKDHALFVTGESGPCPAYEPVPVHHSTPLEPLPTPDRAAGKGVRVVVVDTGIDFESVARHRWLKGVRGDPDADIIADPRIVLTNYAGHGTFIAGMVRMVAPKAEIIVRRAFGTVGNSFESDLVQTLDRVLHEDHPDIISMSAGTFADDATGLLAFDAFHRNRLRHHKGVAFVAAAGNQGRRRAFWPAAAPWTVSVGSLDKAWRRRADFSNHGGWVDVYAPGEDLVNAFPRGRYTYREPENAGGRADFAGLARWGGTSFSTPLVAGLIAARMWRTGENGHTAAEALLAEARVRHQYGVGAVLLPL